MAKRKKEAKPEPEPERLSLEWFKAQGSKGGKKGGAKAWENLTPEQRSARARENASKRKWHPIKPKPEAETAAEPAAAPGPRHRKSGQRLKPRRRRD